MYQVFVDNENPQVSMLKFLDLFFFIFHSSLVVFNCFGCLFRKFRRWNLITLLLTGFSWFFLGIWYGWGYCFCTDWHWSVRRELGYVDNTNSYIDLLIQKTIGLDLPDPLVDRGTLIVFLLSLLISIFFNVRDQKRKKPLHL